MEKRIHDYDWCYLSGWINVLECNLLNVNFFERLLTCANSGEVLTTLHNTFLKAYFTYVKHLYEFEAVLDDYYYGRLYEVRALSPDGAICDIFLLKRDCLNLKNLIKNKIEGIGTVRSSVESKEKDGWTDIWKEANSLPEVFKRSISFLKAKMNTVKKESLPFIIDLIFDGAYLVSIEHIYHKIKVEIIRRYLKIYQLVRGLEIIRRAMVLETDMKLLEQYFLEGFDKEHVFHKLVLKTVWTSEKTLHEAFTEAYCNTPLPGKNFVQMLSSNLFPAISFRYKKLTGNYLLDLIRSAKYIPFGPERVFGYLCGLTTEVVNLKLVLGGKTHRIENNVLRERLRETYV